MCAYAFHILSRLFNFTKTLKVLMSDLRRGKIIKNCLHFQRGSKIILRPVRVESIANREIIILMNIKTAKPPTSS